MANTELAAATGRRKTSVARVRLFSGTGKWSVNGREIEDYFTSEATRKFLAQPLVITASADRFDVEVSTNGGGPTGQAGATRHALSRALCLIDAEMRAPLKAAGCLTRDSRMKERKKPGQPGARKRFQFSKR